MEKKNAGVEAVDKALQILNSFSEKREELTLTEISKLNNGTAHTVEPLIVWHTNGDSTQSVFQRFTSKSTQAFSNPLILCCADVRRHGCASRD